MSLADGMAALNLEMPSRVPRTEYSAERHWDLVCRVTGIDVGPDSPAELQQNASAAFCKAWNYDFFWSILISRGEFGEMRTRMGHAVYAAGAVDFDQRIESPFKTYEDVLRFDPFETFGPRDKAVIRKRFEDHYRANCKRNPDGVNMTGIYTTLVSGFIDLFGWDLLLEASAMDPDGAGALAARYAAWIGQYFEALAEADLPVVMIHDDMVWTQGAVWRPEWYRRFIFPHYKKFMGPIRDSGKKIVFTSDGTYTEFIDDIVACGAHGFVLEPTTDMALIAEKYGKTHAFVGNADTRILLSGTRPQIRAEVQRCMDIGKKYPGFFMAVGNHIPSNTPVENALYYNEAYEELSVR